MKSFKITFIIPMLLTLFVLGCKDDDPAVVNTDSPTVTLTDPSNDATGVKLNHQITATFSEAMDASTINTTTYGLKQGSTSIAGTVGYSGTSATFTPASNLQPNSVFTGTITTGAKNMDGLALATNHTFSFTTGSLVDIILPTVMSTIPLNSATNVSRNNAIKITFSEAMMVSSINSSTFTLAQGTANVSGNVSYSGTTATFTPAIALAANTSYTAKISTGAKDLAGNALSAATTWNFTTSATSTLSAVDLGTSANYVILAKTAISNVPTSAITGDLGLSPAAESFITGFTLTAATGFSTATEVTGKVYAADQASPTPINLTTAISNMETAYTDAAGRSTPNFVELGAGDLSGLTLTSGLYKWTSTVTVPTDITISGSADDIWIFQIAGDLTVSSAVNMTLTGGAQAKNIFWQVAGEATFGTTSHVEGNILSMTGITLKTGASLNGRALAQSAVILDGNTVVKP